MDGESHLRLVAEAVIGHGVTVRAPATPRQGLTVVPLQASDASDEDLFLCLVSSSVEKSERLDLLLMLRNTSIIKARAVHSTVGRLPFSNAQAVLDTIVGMTLEEAMRTGKERFEANTLDCPIWLETTQLLGELERFLRPR
jgi:hypothetical protein